MIAFILEGNGGVSAGAGGASAAGGGAALATALLVGVIQMVFVRGGPGGGTWTSMRNMVMSSALALAKRICYRAIFWALRPFA
jgi:hypothetical protein